MNACTEPFLIVYSILSGFISNISVSRLVRSIQHHIPFSFVLCEGWNFFPLVFWAHRIHGRRQILFPFCIHSISKWKCQNKTTNIILSGYWLGLCMYIVHIVHWRVLCSFRCSRYLGIGRMKHETERKMKKKKTRPIWWEKMPTTE